MAAAFRASLLISRRGPPSAANSGPVFGGGGIGGKAPDVGLVRVRNWVAC